MSKLLTQFSRYLKKEMSAENPGRPMKYPYTLTAKIVQFPFKFYYNSKSSWVIKFWLIASICTLPVFYKIQKLSYSPENVRKWAELDRKTFSGHH